MALGITYTAADSTADLPQFGIQVTGLDTDPSWTHYTITREIPSLGFPEAIVRGADFQPIVLATVNVDDYECPLLFGAGAVIQYRVDVYDVSGSIVDTLTGSLADWSAFTAGARRTGSNFWIKNIANPTLSRQVYIEEWPTVDIPATILGKYKVLGRAKPVVFSDAWGGYEGSFAVSDISLNSYQLGRVAAEALLTSGDVLLIQNHLHPLTMQDMYFVVSDLGREIYGGKLLANRTPEFRYDVSFVEVDRPETTASPANLGIWLDLENDGSIVSWIDLAAVAPTGTSVLERYST